jgi:hypothetical protein
METIVNDSPRALGPLHAYLWNRGSMGWDLEIASGHIRKGFKVHSYQNYPSKAKAMQAAKQAGALPWNY